MYREPGSGRQFYYILDNKPDGSSTTSYSYTWGSYYRVYIAQSGGSYRTYDSDGYTFSYQAPEAYGYWYTDSKDGTRDYIYIFKDPAHAVHWWVVYDYDPQGNYVFTYVYYRDSYYYVEVRHSTGGFTKYDSTGYSQKG